MGPPRQEEAEDEGGEEDVEDVEEKENGGRERTLRLLTWNVNRAEPSDTKAFDALLVHVQSLAPQPHVIALQLASKAFAAALASALGWSPHATHHSTPGSGWDAETHGNAAWPSSQPAS